MKSENAQVTIDYITGMGIFLISVAFVFQFTYSLFIPFHSGSDEVTLAADRASTVLVERLLRADRAESMNVVEQSKITSFIDTNLNYTDNQNYTAGLSQVGLYSKYIIFDLNISVANLTNPDSPVYQGGLELPDNTDIGQSSQLVLVLNSTTGYNETSILSVRVW